jgi:hypothetical protein
VAVRTENNGAISARETTIVTSGGRLISNFFLPLKTVIESLPKINCSQCGHTILHSQTAAQAIGNTLIMDGSRIRNKTEKSVIIIIPIHEIQ